MIICRFELKQVLSLYDDLVEFIEGSPVRQSDLERVSADKAMAFFLLADHDAPVSDFTRYFASWNSWESACNEPENVCYSMNSTCYPRGSWWKGIKKKVFCTAFDRWLHGPSGSPSWRLGPDSPSLGCASLLSRTTPPTRHADPLGSTWSWNTDKCCLGWVACWGYWGHMSSKGSLQDDGT